MERALRQASGEGINLVIGLGDWSRVGTLEELTAAKKVFDQSKVPYYLTAGDHDLWDSRNRGKEPLSNFEQVFGKASQEIEREGIQIVIVDNSDIYKGISQEGWEILKGIKGTKSTTGITGSNNDQALDTLGTHDSRDTPRLAFVFAHKTPFHPDSEHVMGEDSEEVSRQARNLIDLLGQKKIDGFFSGDLHFFAQFKDPSGLVKMTTVGAVARERNFQGPRFAIVTVFNDYSWDIRDVEIR